MTTHTVTAPQLTLDDLGDVAEPRGQLSLYPNPIDQRFLRFHHDNPHVYRLLVAMAREWKAAGHERCSMGMLFEVLRWDSGVRTKSADGLKLNHDFRSRYARVIAANEPSLAGLFETRALATERGGDRG